MIRRAFALALASLLAVACSGGSPGSTESSPQQTAACIKPDTFYLGVWTEQSGGSCGKHYDTAFSTLADGTRKPMATPCSGTIAENGCTEVITSYACSEGDYTETQSGQMTWAADGLSATGVVEVSRSGRLTCKSSYAVRVERE
jgi:hypothetical protein